MRSVVSRKREALKNRTKKGSKAFLTVSRHGQNSTNFHKVFFCKTFYPKNVKHLNAPAAERLSYTSAAAVVVADVARVVVAYVAAVADADVAAVDADVASVAAANVFDVVADADVACVVVAVVQKVLLQKVGP